MTFTPRIVTDTIGTAGKLLVTPVTEESEIRDWLDAAYGSPAELHYKLDEETSAAMIEALEQALKALTCEHPERLDVSDWDFQDYLGLKVEYLDEWDSSHYEWRPNDQQDNSWESSHNEIIATAPDGATIRFYAHDRGDQGIVANFLIDLVEKEFGKDYASTEDTADWPVIERYIPRDEWPSVMPVGQHGPRTRTPAPEVQEMIQAAETDRAQDFAETYKIVLDWLDWTHPGETVRDDGAVILEDWTHPVEEWEVRVSKVIEASLDPDDEANYVEPPEWLNNFYDGFTVDGDDENPVDTTDSEPYEEAEDRLLAKAGLPRSTVLRVDGPW